MFLSQIILLISLRFCFGQDCSTLEDIRSCSLAIGGGTDKRGCLWVPLDNKTAGLCVTRSTIKSCSDFGTKLGSPSNGRFSCENGYGRGILSVTEIIKKTSFSWNGKPYHAYSNRTDSESLVQITVRQIKIQPHTKSAIHTHSAPSLLYVKSGELTVTEVSSDGVVVNETHVKAGQVLPELVDTPHYMSTQGSTVVLISYYTGVVGQEPAEPVESRGITIGPTMKNITISTMLKRAKTWDDADLGRYPEGAPELSLVKITIKPGALLGSHIHIMPNIEYVLQGTLAIVKSETRRKKIIGPGDVLAEVVFTPHYGFNVKSNDVVLLVLYVGVQGLPYSLPYGGPAAIPSGSGECMWVAATEECKEKPLAPSSQKKEL